MMEVQNIEQMDKHNIERKVQNPLDIYSSVLLKEASEIIMVD